MLITPINIESLDAIDIAAEKLLQACPKARVFAFRAPMGAGKTTFIKAICRKLGVTTAVSSPTFTLINEYPTDSQQSLYHFDFYRLKSASEAFDTGAGEILFSGSYCFVEWPELAEAILPEDTIRLKITINETDNSRIVESDLS